QGRPTLGLCPSGGRGPTRPASDLGGSQPPTAGRQTVPAVTKSSTGQSFPCPSQLSATSQAPPDGRQTAVLLASAGHEGLVPVQLSAGSQTPADGRHTVPDGATSSGGQSLLTPSQLSATSHASAAGRQTAVLFVSAGQLGPAPVQLSAGSQAPAEHAARSAAGVARPVRRSQIALLEQIEDTVAADERAGRCRYEDGRQGQDQQGHGPRTYGSRRFQQPPAQQTLCPRSLKR